MRTKKKQKSSKKCSTCMGHGLWWDDSGAPMGPLDASDGLTTKPCPECGANTNPAEKLRDATTELTDDPKQQDNGTMD